MEAVLDRAWVVVAAAPGELLGLRPGAGVSCVAAFFPHGCRERERFYHRLTPTGGGTDADRCWWSWDVN